MAQKRSPIVTISSPQVNAARPTLPAVEDIARVVGPPIVIVDFDITLEQMLEVIGVPVYRKPDGYGIWGINGHHRYLLSTRIHSPGAKCCVRVYVAASGREAIEAWDYRLARQLLSATLPDKVWAHAHLVQ